MLTPAQPTQIVEDLKWDFPPPCSRRADSWSPARGNWFRLLSTSPPVVVAMAVFVLVQVCLFQPFLFIYLFLISCFCLCRNDFFWDPIHDAQTTRDVSPSLQEFNVGRYKFAQYEDTSEVFCFVARKTSVNLFSYELTTYVLFVGNDIRYPLRCCPAQNDLTSSYVDSDPTAAVFTGSLYIPSHSNGDVQVGTLIVSLTPRYHSIPVIHQLTN